MCNKTLVTVRMQWRKELVWAHLFDSDFIFFNQRLSYDEFLFSDLHITSDMQEWSMLAL